MMDKTGRRRIVIENVLPQIDCGRFPIKRAVGESVVVEADVFVDGHDVIACVLRHRSDGARRWTDVRMEPLDNDRWRGSFSVYELGRHRYTIVAWVDRFSTWRRDLVKRLDAAQDVSIDLLSGADLVARAAARARGLEQRTLRETAEILRSDLQQGIDAALDDELLLLMEANPDRTHASQFEQELDVVVDPPRARFSTWYEMFPRSASTEPGRHGTFDDVIARLPYVASMGFDVLYLPPIHPIGHTNRKGPNNDPAGGEEVLGSPWAIGSEEGGHADIHPQLGTMEDFERLVGSARDMGIEVALDIAFQCSPDHPWVKKHPEWFIHRPDGTIQYAENPPKKYEDIYPINFETDAWQELWEELRGVVEHWISRGVRIFRVDNPHTKALAFWEWMIAEVNKTHPDVIFLSEAFTRPKVMYRLAKLGFDQSYTYFAWRTEKWELEQYFTELTQTEVAEFFRPNLWPNTPDILTEQIQRPERQTFTARLILAATLGANYGIYGPAFELMEHRPLVPGREEYLDSEKYQLRHWEIERPDSLRAMIGLVNRIRQENTALQGDRSLRFCPIENNQLIAYFKTSEDRSNVILTVVNLDPHATQSGWVGVPWWDLGLQEQYQAHDLLTGARYTWNGEWNYVELNPFVLPAHIFRLGERPHDERDYEHFV